MTEKLYLILPVISKITTYDTIFPRSLLNIVVCVDVTRVDMVIVYCQVMTPFEKALKKTRSRKAKHSAGSTPRSRGAFSLVSEKEKSVC